MGDQYVLVTVCMFFQVKEGSLVSQFKGFYWSQFKAWWWGILKILSKKDSPWAPLKETLASAPDDQYCCKSRRHWALGIHITAEGGPHDPSIDAGDFQIKLARKRSSWHWGKLLLPKTTDQDFVLELNMKPFLFPFLDSGIGQKDNALICISQAIAKEVTSGTESNLLFQGSRKSNYASKCLQAKEDISLVSSPNLHHGVRKEPLEGF